MSVGYYWESIWWFPVLLGTYPTRNILAISIRKEAFQQQRNIYKNIEQASTVRCAYDGQRDLQTDIVNCGCVRWLFLAKRFLQKRQYLPQKFIWVRALHAAERDKLEGDRERKHIGTLPQISSSARQLLRSSRYLSLFNFRLCPLQKFIDVLLYINDTKRLN
uniref:Uncharacterized protein n=1 Tax=Glossina palpalis gambiensis TaxID=67801 RepID=A0A1B0BF76_9MUSC